MVQQGEENNDRKGIITKRDWDDFNKLGMIVTKKDEGDSQ